MHALFTPSKFNNMHKILHSFSARLVMSDCSFLQCIQLFFSKTLFDFKKSISGPIELKFSGKTLNAILYAPIYIWGVYF